MSYLKYGSWVFFLVCMLGCHNSGGLTADDTDNNTRGICANSTALSQSELTSYLGSYSSLRVEAISQCSLLIGVYFTDGTNKIGVLDSTGLSWKTTVPVSQSFYPRNFKKIGTTWYLLGDKSNLGVIYSSEDLGQSWIRHEITPFLYCSGYDIESMNGSLYIGSTCGNSSPYKLTILKTDNTFSSFIKVKEVSSDSYGGGIAKLKKGGPSGCLYAGGYNWSLSGTTHYTSQVLLKSCDGTSWTELRNYAPAFTANNTINDFVFYNNEVFVLGTEHTASVGGPQSKIYKLDSADSWSDITSLVTTTKNDIQKIFSNDNDCPVIAVGRSDESNKVAYFSSTDCGANWVLTLEAQGYYWGSAYLNNILYLVTRDSSGVSRLDLY